MNKELKLEDVFATEAKLEEKPNWIMPDDPESTCNRPYYVTEDGVTVIDDPWHGLDNPDELPKDIKLSDVWKPID